MSIRILLADDHTAVRVGSWSSARRAAATTRSASARLRPVNGVFELRGDKITSFRDYFDLATFESRSGLKL